MEPNNIIILDTNQVRRDYLRSLTKSLGFTTFTFEKVNICLDNIKHLNPGMVISGSLSLQKTYRFIYALKMINNDLSVLIISNEAVIQEFIHINGFKNIIITKESFSPVYIRETIKKLHSGNRENNECHDISEIIGQSREMIKIKKMISELSESGETILIRGEPGTGKDLIAQTIHQRSKWRDDPFIKINLSKLPKERTEDEAFRHSALAIAGADKNQSQKSGTLFLDMIDKIPVTLQSSLLHILEEGSFPKYNPVTTEKIKIRVIAATNVDLGFLAETGKFRKDLFFRLNIMGIKIPPLRKRIKDIPILTDYFIDKLCIESGKSFCEISEKISDVLCRFYWPGNVGELKNVVKNIDCFENEESVISQLYTYNKKIDSKKDEIKLKNITNFLPLSDLSRISLKDICNKSVKHIEKKLMQKALEKTNWNRKKAASILNISYKSMLNKIKAYNITC